MRRVLAFVDYYLPGSKGGGPAVSVSRRAESLAGRCEFLVFTRDRDLGDTYPYSGIEVDAWNGDVFYSSSLRLRAIRKAVSDANADVVYLNSFFSRMTRGVLLLKLTGALYGVRVVIAPRGELDEGALGIKSWKKRQYLRAIRATGLCRNVSWHATSAEERRAIQAVFPDARVVVAAESGPSASSTRPKHKPGGFCEFVFLSRISRKKNLHYLVRALRPVVGSAALHVYGPVEDERYWKDVEDEARLLPPNVSFHYHGPVSNAAVPETFAQHHVFVLPTLGENFCHVIVESLSCGLPCVISDRTPWSAVEKAGAGWVESLENLQSWTERLQACIDMGPDEYGQAVEQARLFYSDIKPAESDFEPVWAA